MNVDTHIDLIMEALDTMTADPDVTLEELLGAFQDLGYTLKAAMAVVVASR